jgi:hypothetical protein
LRQWQLAANKYLSLEHGINVISREEFTVIESLEQVYKLIIRVALSLGIDFLN